MNDEFEQTPELAVPEEPVLSLPSDVVPQPTPEPAGPPVEVISVDELIERLTQGDEQLEAPAEADEEIEAAADVPIVDPDPVSIIAEEVAGHLIDLITGIGRIEEHTKEIEKDTDAIQAYMEVVARTLDHPALTTSFADYTVTEALLLLLLLSAFLSACARMLRGGLSWLRS